MVERFDEVPGARLPACKFETDHRAETVLLAGGDLVSGMVLQPGVVDPAHFGVSRQEIDDGPGV